MAGTIENLVQLADLSAGLSEFAKAIKATFVNVSGDTMTGDLIIDKEAPSIILTENEKEAVISFQNEKINIQNNNVTLSINKKDEINNEPLQLTYSNDENTYSVIHTGNKNLIRPGDIQAGIATAGVIPNDTDILNWAKQRPSTVGANVIENTSLINSPVENFYGNVLVTNTGNQEWTIELFSANDKKSFYNSTKDGNWIGWTEFSTENHHKYKIYNNLSDIGITTTSTTSNILSQMPTYSILNFYNTSLVSDSPSTNISITLIKHNNEGNGTAIQVDNLTAPLSYQYVWNNTDGGKWHQSVLLDNDKKIPAINNTALVKTLSELSTYTLVKEDAGKFLRFTGSADKTITIPADSSNAIFPLGTELEIFLTNGSASVTIQNEGGALYLPNVFKDPGNCTSINKWPIISLKKVDTTRWVVRGEVV